VVCPNRVVTTQERAALDQRYPDLAWTDIEDGSASATLITPPLGDLIKALSEWLAKASSRLLLSELKSTCESCKSYCACVGQWDSRTLIVEIS
jgi:hypothetical protein